MITRRLLVIAATAGALHVTPPAVRRRTRLAAATVSTTTERTLAVASNRGDLRAAAELCGVAFPPASADEHFRVLSDPACLANVFFDVRGRASVALLREERPVDRLARSCLVLSEGGFFPTLANRCSGSSAFV